MRQEIRIGIKPKFSQKYRSGYPLIEKEAIVNLGELNEEGILVKLVDEHQRFIAKGYYGRQNKGYGWVLTQKETEPIDQHFFLRKIEQALKARQAFYNDPETTAFRVFNGEGDGVGGVTIDYFDGYYLIQWYSEGIYTFKDDVIHGLQAAPHFKGIYEKKRFDSKGKYIEDDDFVTGTRAEFPLTVLENGVRFAINLNEGAMVGLFLDQRDVRNTIKNTYAQGKTVINMFSYTGAFSVCAALGGATKTTSVDVANRSLPKTIENFQLNAIDETTQAIIVEDVFKYFKYAVRKQLKFDMVILDPPSFARTKKHTFSVTKDYKNLLKEALEITEDQGIIVASTNNSSLSMGKFKSFIDTAFKESGASYRIEEEFSLPRDFRTIKEFEEGNYLKVVFVRKV
ncbi:23S rRNA (cytosine1962-C5)-methyltransferase [Pullulanibacillus pueri]|uniref:Methyltransferase n=1 Tax=Pullulanibacillus pueri TaxID=1437324 RepID=A0A8J3ES10_9BACL|nr:class I SAM-dependent rRNA methyltransferase [Pullulanibacillus pueri]MBM7684048.1 23S rRNA (cytosine1962-C5)-methyltransferase [Pullulanibacillus pueri]GGH88462.1 methyltransferase [Pullulanibacillus pueri]